MRDVLKTEEEGGRRENFDPSKGDETAAPTARTTATPTTRLFEDVNEKDLPPSMKPEDVLGEGVSEQDLYRFLEDLDEMAPTIPDQYTNSVLKTVGVDEPDVRVTRMISIAAQKFMSQIAEDCFKVTVNKLTALPKEEKVKKINQRVVLTPETLGEVLSEYGVSMRKPSMFVGGVGQKDEEVDIDKLATEARDTADDAAK